MCVIRKPVLRTPRQKRVEKSLRWIRAHPALYGDLGPLKEKQAERIRDKCKAILAPVFRAERDESEHLKGQRLLQTWA